MEKACVLNNDSFSHCHHTLQNVEWVNYSAPSFLHLLISLTRQRAHLGSMKHTQNLSPSTFKFSNLFFFFKILFEREKWGERMSECRGVAEREKEKLVPH